MTVSITELQERLHEILREVETNGTIVNITRDGQVIAHIVPATHTESPQAPAGKMPA